MLKSVAISSNRHSQYFNSHFLRCLFLNIYFNCFFFSGNFGNYIPSKLGTNEEAFLGDYGVSRGNIMKTVKRTVDKNEEDTNMSVIDMNVPWSEETTPDLLF